MAKRVIKWNMTKMVWVITNMLQNKFDAVIVIEGNRGLGKSTLAIQLARRVAREFKKQGSQDYKFHWSNSLVYTKKETKRFLHKWDSIGIADEMINVTFNRDFYNSEQKDIIKLLNMNRDHCNLFISCVPSFATLDSQIKNLCKIRITVVRRGMCIIQTPNQTIYIKDKWDQATNEKIERGWLMKGITKPHYTKLTTFRGVMKFSKLREKSELKYQKVKDKKRNLVAKEEMGITDDKEKETDPVNIAINMLKAGKVKNGTFLDGIAQGHGMNCSTFKDKIRRKLKNQGGDHKLTNYYWEIKAKKKKENSISINKTG
jgi:hypothetical protein